MKKINELELIEFLSRTDHYAMISRCDGMWAVTLHSPVDADRQLIYKSGELPLHPVAESVISSFIVLGAERVHVRYDLVDISIVVEGWAAVKLYHFALEEIDRLREVRDGCI